MSVKNLSIAHYRAVQFSFSFSFSFSSVSPKWLLILKPNKFSMLTTPTQIIDLVNFWPFLSWAMPHKLRINGGFLLTVHLLAGYFRENKNFGAGASGLKEGLSSLLGKVLSLPERINAQQAHMHHFLSVHPPF